jgi:transposase
VKLWGRPVACCGFADTCTVQVPTEVRTEGGRIGGSPKDWQSQLSPIPTFVQNPPLSCQRLVSATIMAPQLDAAKHILIKALLKNGFETKLIASVASCSVRAVQRIRLKQFEMPTQGTNRVGRRSCITPAMRNAIYDLLIEQPYLYRCEMADFLYRKFRERISERSIGRFLRSIGWTRTMIHRIAQQRNADL